MPIVALKKAGVRVEEVLAGNQEGAMAQLKAAGWTRRRSTRGSSRSTPSARACSFRAIYTSEPFPELAVIAHPRVAAAVVDKVRQALLAMKTDPAAAPVLEQAKSPGFEPATDRDYDGVRRVYRLIGQ